MLRKSLMLVSCGKMLLFETAFSHVSVLVFRTDPDNLSDVKYVVSYNVYSCIFV